MARERNQRRIKIQRTLGLKYFAGKMSITFLNLLFEYLNMLPLLREPLRWRTGSVGFCPVPLNPPLRVVKKQTLIIQTIMHFFILTYFSASFKLYR